MNRDTMNYPADLQGAMGIILKSTLRKMGISLNICELCKVLGIGRTTAYEARDKIDDLLSAEPESKERVRELEAERDKEQTKNRESDFIKSALRFQLDHPDCFIGGKSPYYSDAYKLFILEQKSKFQLTFGKIYELIGIPENTLKKFPQVKESTLPTNLPKELPENVLLLINAYLQSKGNKSVKKFCLKNPELLEELDMNYRQVLAWLRKLGLAHPKNGKFLKNTGLDRIIRFTPNAIWGTDGKQMNIIINGQEFVWIWQCLVDYKTTVIIGGIIAKEETTDNLLEAIKASKEKHGITPMAIVLDNRLSENIPAIKEFLDKYEIDIINTFPANPKSNLVENNFSVFERWIGGTVSIEGNDPQAISKSIAQMLIEVFTQLRNHKHRKGFLTKTPKELMDDAIDNPISDQERETIRQKLKELSDRFKRDLKEPAVDLLKNKAIDLAVIEVKPNDEEKFRKSLSQTEYTHFLIFQAIAIFLTCQQDRPDKCYDYKYFGGILRNITNNSYLNHLNTNLKDIFYNKLEDLYKRTDDDILKSLKIDPVKTCLYLAEDFLDMPVPAWSNMILLQFKDIFFLATAGTVQKAKSLCEQIANIVVSWSFKAKKKREFLLCKLYEWVNFIQIYEVA